MALKVLRRLLAKKLKRNRSEALLKVVDLRETGGFERR